jgi:hypothetical protein
MMNLLDSRKRHRIDFGKKGLLLAFLVVLNANLFFVPPFAFSAPGSSSVIALGEFRWASFPLKVYVDVNNWALPSYAVVVREAVDDWVKSIWNYTQTYNGTSLPTIDYLYYVSDVNSTDHYDVVISFTSDKMPPTSNTVGLTNCSWNAVTHTPIAPITINITTFSGTATDLFVKNVAMHEFGHALGLGHASSANTLNGPELMYSTSLINEVVYPSTLDVYGLMNLYNGKFGQNVQLPPSIPYVMLAEGTIPIPQTSLLNDYRPYLPLLAVLGFLIAAAIVLGHLSSGEKDQGIPQPPPPPTVDASNALSYVARARPRRARSSGECQ